MAEQATSALQTTWCYTKLGVGGLLVLFALFLLRPDSDYIQQMERLEYAGRTAMAKVVGKMEGDPAPTSLPPKGGGAAGSAARGFIAGKRLANAANGRDHFYLEFQFKTSAGEEIKDRGIVSAAYFRTIAMGAELEVIYLPEDPTINRLIDGSEPFKRMPQSILFTFSIIVGSIGAFLIWWNWPSRTTIGGGGDDSDTLARVRGNGRLARPVVASGDIPAPRARPKPAPRRQGFGQRA